MEHQFDLKLTPFRKLLNDMQSKKPSDILFDRTNQSTNTDVVIDDTGSILEIYKLFRLKLEGIQCKEAQRERLANKILEESMYICLVNRYLMTIGNQFKEYENGTLEVALVTSKETGLGLVVTPREIAETLSLEKIDYQSYLLVVLRLVDVIVDYTTSAIIQASVGSNDSESKIDYTIAVINLQIVSKLQNGFQLLDLKNDILRKRFDGLKYNSQRLNKIVYDLTLRNLISIKGDVC